MDESKRIPKDPTKAVWLFIGLCLLLVFTDLLSISERLWVLLFFFALIPAFYVKNDWAWYSTTERRLFKSGYLLSGLITFILIAGDGFGGDTLIDRDFRWYELTVYYAIEEPHFYEEAYVTFGKIGFSGIESKRVFVQDCCGHNILKYYDHYSQF